jgi:ribonuclease-3
VSRREFFDRLGYVFKDESLFETAVTHSSYVREVSAPQSDCNERLEFLGDAYLDMIISKKLFDLEPRDNEGVLTKQRALIVCGPALAEVARKIGLGEEMILGHGEERTGGRDRESIIADAMEAVIAAISIDGGYEEAERVVLDLFADRINNVMSGRITSDYKSAFQEVLQANGPVDIRYETVREEGPDHDKTFYVEVFVSEKACGSGSGKSKKEAEQNAAKDALEKRDK